MTGIKGIEFAVSAIPGASRTSGGVIEIRIDSPTGKLIGQTSDILLVKNERGKNIPSAKATIDSVSGVHDIYFVFINKTTGDTNSQMQVRNIKFVQ